MGLDYWYAGSVSSPRFDKEVKGIVELFGGTVVKKKKNNEDEIFEYNFPEGIPEVFKEWAKSPCEFLCFTKTKELADFIFQKKEKAKEISSQIIYELESLIIDHECWSIS